MIPFVREIKFDYGACDKVSPLIRRVVANNPGPFTFLGTGTYIVGHDEVAVIDPGPDMADHLTAILDAVEGERITHILLTHHHSDHSPLTEPLKVLTGATVVGCAVPQVIDDSGVQVEAGYGAPIVHDVEVCDGAVIKGPGWTLEAIPTPGHTSNHICYALKEENALFSGDHIMGWSTTVITPPDGDMADYFRSLDLIKARNFQTLWPTHGPPITDVAPFIDAYAAHRRDRERQILDAIDKGLRTIGDMVPVLYAATDKRLHPAAARSVLAHLIQLAGEGRVLTDGAAGPASTYRLP